MVDAWEYIDTYIAEATFRSKHYFPITFSPFGAILAVMGVTYLSKVLASILLLISTGGLDNANPRDQVYPKRSAARRACAAHENGFEALLVFSISVFMAVIANVPKTKLEDLCTLFVVTRVVYTLVYTFLSFNQVLAMIRSAVFVLGFAVCGKIMIMAINAKFGFVYH